VEDIERQAILERAGWRVVRVPYRKWIADAGREVQRILAALVDEAAQPDDCEEEARQGVEEEAPAVEVVRPAAPPAPTGSRIEPITREQAAILEAMKNGMSDEEAVLRRVRETLGFQRLGKRVRASLVASAGDLARRGLLAIEEGEYFATAKGRSAEFQVTGTSSGRRRASLSGSDEDQRLVVAIGKEIAAGNFSRVGELEAVSKRLPARYR